MRRSALRNATLAAAALSVAVAPSLAQSARDLNDLVGARGSSGESQLDARGFTYITGHEGRYSSNYSFWWNSRSKKCVRVETRDGRYAAITDASNSDCNQKGGGDAGTAVAVVAGAALLGALLAHKSSHHDDGKHYDDRGDDAAYERGFSDGIHNTAYHNYDRSDAYSRGYEAGVEQRSRNTGYHQQRGGYVETARFDDLGGARAAGADSELSTRGFRSVDSFTSGDTRYTIYWRGQSRQCLQATIVDGRIYDIRDIQTHPRCR